MGIEIVGYRRLYSTLACYPSDFGDLTLQDLRIPNFGVDLYIGMSPKFGRLYVASDRFAAPVAPHGYSGSVPEPLLKGSLSEAPEGLYTEVTVWASLSVSDEISAAFGNGDEQAGSEIARLAKRYIEDFPLIADTVVGAVGLRMHRQLVIKLLAENLMVKQHNNTDDLLIEVVSDFTELLDNVLPNRSDGEQLKIKLEVAGFGSGNAWRTHAPVLRWLLRAWDTQDRVNQFVSFFIPLEMILQGHSVQVSKQFHESAQAIRSAIKKSSGEKRQSLLTFFNDLANRQTERPSLEQRFASYAERAKLSGWEQDIIAFGQYNKTRNAVVHRGMTDVHLHLSSVTKELLGLQDLAERYISYAVFGDDNVYISRLRRMDLEAKLGILSEGSEMKISVTIPPLSNDPSTDI